MSVESQAQTLLKLKDKYLVPCVCHFYKDPPVIARGEGVYLFDTKGKRYLDCYSGVTVMSAGHGNPRILRAVIDQLRRLQHTTTIYLTEPVLRLAESLAAIAPGNLGKSFFCASGSEANEAAMLLATLYTGRHGFIALSASLHGRTKWAMSATGLDLWRTDARLLNNVYHAPHPYCMECPIGETFPGCAYACAAKLERHIQDAGPENIAALIAEPIQGNGGIIVPPDGYWHQVRNLCDRYNILLILDEVQTAMNRTGRWFASEHWGLVPDIVTMAKALGNGLPIAAMITTDDIAAAYTRPGASTFGANPVACSGALAVLDFHSSERLGERSEARGAQLLQGLQSIAADHPHLAKVRGKGLMIGVSVIDAGANPDAARCDAYLERLKDAGFLAGKTGQHRNTLTFMPPLTISETEIATLLDSVAEL
ncbi:MAG: aspartate aminotransferase family protein [Candidatus Hydrogenedentes bacterium]|nr:aspartate aminotransferase family protein [Candidatus Hydrogenedentota bacterium]